MWLRLHAGLLVCFLLQSAAYAQRPPRLDPTESFRRPKLAADADTNSWEAYFDFGVKQLRQSPRKAEAAFVWSSRLNPTRAEPLFGRWVAFWRRNPGWFEDYVAEKPWVIDSPQILQVDSLYWRALLRNPFVPRHLAVLLYEQLPGRWGVDPFTIGVLAYSAGRYDEATQNFNRMLRDDSVKNYRVRFYLALCHTATRQFDSAATQIRALLGEMHRRSEAHLAYFYDSRELLQYSLGMLHRALGANAQASEDMGQSLTENLAFYPAHAELGELALGADNKNQAVAEYAQATELGPDDGVMHYRYGQVLQQVGRLNEAEVELRHAVELEPYYAPAYFALALVLESLGQRPGAVEQYRMFLALADQGDTQIDLARRRIAALSP